MKKIILICLCLLIPFTAHAGISTSTSKLRIQEEDGSPTGRPRTLKVTNTTLTDNGDGSFSLDTTGKPAHTVTVAESGGDYTSIQTALNNNRTDNTLFIIYPDTYVNDTINFTANDQCIVGAGLTAQSVITNTAQIIDYGAYTGCRMNNIKLVGTYTTAIDMITGSGGLIARDVHLEVNVSGAIAGSPTVVNTTGSFKQVRGSLIYKNDAISTGQIKQALTLGTSATVELRRVIVDIDGSNASTAITLGYGAGTGVLNAYRCKVDIEDADAVIVNGLAYLGGSGDHEYLGNDLHVTCGGDGKFAYGFLCTTATSLSIRSMFNHLHIEDGGGTGKSYGMSIGADCTVVSQFDDIVAADGVVNNGTFTVANSTADGDFTATGTVDSGKLVVDTDTLVVNATGHEDRVGIGTDSPNKTLHLHSEDTGTYFKITNGGTGIGGNDGFDFVIYNDDVSLINREYGSLKFRTNNIHRMTVDKDGDVGIGTATPTANFQVSQSTTGEGTVTITSTTACAGTGTDFLNTFKVGDTITITDTAETKVISAIASDTAMTIVAGTNVADSAYTLAGGDRLSVLGNGNVGIGTATPNSLLQVGDGTGNPEFRIYGDASTPGTGAKYAALDINTWGMLKFSGDIAGVYYNTNLIINGSSTIKDNTSQAQIGFGDSQSSGQTLMFYNLINNNIFAKTLGYDYGHSAQDNPTVFIHSDNNSQTEWLSFTHDQTNGVFGLGSGAYTFPDGDVGIGTDSPDYLLDVAEIGNSVGDFKIQADVQGDVILFGDTDVGDAVDGRKWILNRKAAEGDRSLEMYIDQYTDGHIDFNTSPMSLQYQGNNDVKFFTACGSGDNRNVRQYGYITAAGGRKYINWQVTAAGNFELTREDSNIGNFDIQMPLITDAITMSAELVATPDEITATSEGVAASIVTLNTEVTTNDDNDLDVVTLADGTSGQIKHIYCVASFTGDTWKITPTTLLGGTQITFGDNSIGTGCTLVFADSEGWIVVGNNGGTIA